MSVQVVLSFPGDMNLETFSNHLIKLEKIGCSWSVRPNGLPIHETEAPIVEGKRSRKNAAKAELETISKKDAMTAAERAILDSTLIKIHQEGSSPLLDSMTAGAIGKLRPNMSKEIINYYTENPGHTTSQCAGHLAERFQAHYQDVNDAFRRIRNLIHTMSHSKTAQKKLESRDGRRGHADSGHIYVLAA